MLARQNRRGAVAGVVVAVIVLVLVLGGVWYFVSDPFHQKVNDTIKGQTKWTPENIKKDPAGYLSWAIDQTAATKSKLDTAQFALRAQLNELDDKLKKNTNDATEYKSLLKDLMDEYTKANEKNSWPVTVRGATFETPDELKDKAVTANSKLEAAQSLVETYAKALSKVKDRLTDIDGQMTKVEKLKTKLETDLETAKVQQTFENIEGVSSTFDDIVHKSDALAQTDEKNASIDEMRKPSGKARVDEEFDKLLQKHKDAGAKK